MQLVNIEIKMTLSLGKNDTKALSFFQKVMKTLVIQSSYMIIIKNHNFVLQY